MARILRRDYDAILAAIDRLHDSSFEHFPHAVLEEVARLVGADHGTFNYLAPSVPKTRVWVSHEVGQHAEREETLAKLLADHPVVTHYLATGDPDAYKVSDFLSVRDYHALPLYRHLYHDLRYEDQLAVILFPPGAELIAVALSRDRRSFTERDREVLTLLRPHVARAYRRAERIALLTRVLDCTTRDGSPLMPCVASVPLDDRGRPLECGHPAETWMRRFFPGRSRGGGSLPDSVQAWLRASLARSGRAGRPDTLVAARDGERLRLRLFPGMGGAARTLVLGLEPAPGVPLSGRPGGLTRRQIEVLRLVEQGRTNDEAAAALGISPATVRKHLEHAFEKLGVTTRTAAVARLRHLTVGALRREPH